MELEEIPASGLPVFGGESWEEHVSSWLVVAESIEGHLWGLASIAASLVTRYGEESVARFASEVGYSARRVWEMAATYRTWESRDRSQSLSFKHHTIAARAEDPAAAIEEAETEELSTRELERKVAGKEPEPMERCPTCNGRGRVPVAGAS